MWKDIIKSQLTEQDIENFLFQIEDVIENIVAKMFKKKYKAGIHKFGDYIVDVRKTTLTVPKMAAVSNLAFKYEFEYGDGKESENLRFASCYIAGTDDGKINDLFFDITDSELYIEYSVDFMRLPDAKQKLNVVIRGLVELQNKV